MLKEHLQVIGWFILMVKKLRKGKEVIAPSAHLYVFSYQGKETLVSLSRDTHLLGYRYEDYSGDSYRFKDDPQEENYDWGALGI